MAVTLLAIIALGALGYVFRPELSSGFDLLTEEAGSTTAAVVCLAVALLVLLWVALWLLLPIVVYIGLKDLRRRASELDETTKLCARHLARLTAGQDQPRNDHVRKQESTGLTRSRPDGPVDSP
jgi:hypothetical protein